MSYVLGLDLGTSALKGLLVDEQGRVIETVSSEYPLISEQKGYSEQDPKKWIKACEDVFSMLKQNVVDFSEELEGISFSGQMHSLVLLDKDKEILRNAILWNDVRTTKQCTEIMEHFGSELLSITKNKALEGFTLPKILWVQENEPTIWEQVRHILLPKDYLRYWLTGKLAMDFSDAAGTLLLDSQTGIWSTRIMDRFKIDSTYLPELKHSAEVAGDIKKNISDFYQFSKQIKVIIGAADNACSAIGAGALDENTAMVSIGTSGVFLAGDKKDANYQGKLHLFNHAIKNEYYAMGVTLAAGHSLTWLKNTFAQAQTFEKFLESADKIESGSNGLLFTPYIVGERTPHADSKIRGSFIGLDTNHSLAHLTRAVMEGVVFSLKDSKVMMEQNKAKKLNKIISVGGGAKNETWLQIQADILDTEIYSLEVEQGPGIGAAILAAVGLGWFSTIQECVAQFVHYKKRIVSPNKENVLKYLEIYELYQEVYPATKDICKRLNQN